MRLAQYDPKWKQTVDSEKGEDFELKKFLELTSALQAQIAVVRQDFVRKMLEKKIRTADELQHCLTYKMQ